MAIPSNGAHAGAGPRRLSLLIVFGALLSLLLPMVMGTPAADAEEHDVAPARVDGANRYDTAAQLADLEFDAAADAFLASGEDFPDALAVSYAAGGAGEGHGPVLLTGPAQIPSVTQNALADLGVDRVILIGGEDAISADVESELEAGGYDVLRFGGDDRYETAVSVVRNWIEGPEGDMGTLAGDRTVLLASGAAFPDALSAGPVAANAEFPLLLTPPDETHAAVDEALQALNADRVIVVGGEAAVSSDVVAHHQDQGYEVERWAGENRRATANVVADNAIERLGFDPALLVLARGDTYPDALTGSVHAGSNAAPILLTQDPDRIGAETRQWIEGACPEVDAIRALGGTAAISSGVLASAVNAAEHCYGPVNNQSYIISPQEPIFAEPGYEQEFHLIGTYDDGPMSAAELALFPCEHVDRDGAHVAFEEDPENPGHARGAGETDTGEAWISQINDVAQSEDQDRDRGFVPENYSFHVQSDATDCTLPVIFDVDDAQPGEIPIDDDGEPLIRFGVGEISWSS